MPSPNRVAKSAGVVAGMLAGADTIDDLDPLRHGGMARLFDGVRAPSTLGTFLRAFTHGHVQQLDKVGAGLLAGLAQRVPALLAGADQVAFVDVDDTIREVHGYAKQAAAYGYTGQRGLNVQLATISTPGAAPVIARARLRRGNTASAAGAGRLLAQTMSTARAAGASGRILARADSAYYGWAFVGTALRHRAWFSVTARMDPKVVAAIASIDESAWTPIKYPNAIFDEVEQRWVSDAEVAEVPYLAFTGRRKTEQVECRLVVRRVRRLQPLASDGSVQGELFATWRHHAFHHQQHVLDRSGRPGPPRARDRRAGHRRAQGRPPGPPALVATPRTLLGSPTPSSPSTSLGRPRSPPRCVTPGGPACAPGSSTSPPGSPRPAGAWCYTYPTGGPGKAPGTTCGPPPPAPHRRSSLTTQPATARPEEPRRGRAVTARGSLLRTLRCAPSRGERAEPRNPTGGFSGLKALIPTWAIPHLNAVTVKANFPSNTFLQS